MLPYIDGYNLGKTIRQAYAKIPIIFLTAKSQTQDILAGFSSGGTDYIKKPFSLEELIARIENQLAIHYPNMEQQTSLNTIQELSLGSFKYAPKKMKLYYNNQEIRLSNRETEIINAFCLSPNEPIDRLALMKMIWGDDSYFISRNLDVYIRRLREYFSLGKGVQIITLKGMGYLFRVSSIDDN
jgi:DNA-binding response OmpR family regulator